MPGLYSCVTWVRRGVAAQHPAPYKLDEDEIKRVSSLARVGIEEMKQQMEKAKNAIRSRDDDQENEESSDNDDKMDQDENQESEKIVADEDDLSAYKLDEYDNDDGVNANGPFTNVGRLAYYDDGEEDPYITLENNESDDERGELEILPMDNLIVAAKTEDDISHLDIYVYDDSQPSLYVHHDIMLPAFPLCLEWIDYFPASSPGSANSTTGNLVAVGTFDPDIEIWSLDTLDQMYPDTVLGRPDQTAQHVPTPAGTGKKKRKKVKPRQINSSHHVDAVLSLSWNCNHRNLLASASADKTVKLWDLSRDPLAEDGSGGAIRSFEVHKDKVQSVLWNMAEPTYLLSGSYDRTARMFDTRSPETGVGTILGADVESMRWDPFEPHTFLISLENGLVLNFDARKLSNDITSPSPARWTLNAHDGAVSVLDVNPILRGCIVTGGTDKQVKVWNISEIDDSQKVSMVTSRDLGVGKVFTAQWCPDEPLILAAAGSKSAVQVWDLSANASTRKTFSSKLAAAGRQAREKERAEVIAAQEDDEDESGWEDE